MVIPPFSQSALTGSWKYCFDSEVQAVFLNGYWILSFASVRFDDITK